MRISRSVIILTVAVVALAAILSIPSKHLPNAKTAYASGQVSCPAGQAVVGMAINTGPSCAAFASAPLTGVTGTITGTLLAVGGSNTGNVTITGAVVGSNCVANATDGTPASTGTFIDCNVGSANTATVRIVAFVIGTPASKAYNVKVFN